MILTQHQRKPSLISLRAEPTHLSLLWCFRRQLECRVWWLYHWYCRVCWLGATVADQSTNDKDNHHTKCYSETTAEFAKSRGVVAGSKGGTIQMMMDTECQYQVTHHAIRIYKIVRPQTMMYHVIGREMVYGHSQGTRIELIFLEHD